jgi:hypothetical protein
VLPDNRLDFITNIHPDYIQKMTDTRAMFIALDELLRMQIKDDSTNKAEASRTASIARTHLEIACQFTIKTFCLLGEIKEPKPEQVF